MNKTEVAHQLAALRKQRGLSQEQLANKSGVALRTIQRIEAASVSAHLQTLSLLSTALDVDLDELTGKDDPVADRAKEKWLLCIHLAPIFGSFFPTGNLVVPFILWLYKRNDDMEFDNHGRAVINFQIGMSCFLGLAFIMIFAFTPIGILLLFGSIIYNVFMVLLNAWRVAHSKPYAYPLSIPLFKKSTLAGALIGLFIFSISSARAQQIKRLDGTAISADSLKNRIEFLMREAKVTGLELAVFKKNKVIYKQAFGKGNDLQKPLHTGMSIYGASLSKTVFAALVMKLVEEKVIALDKPLQSYLPKAIYEYPKKTKWQDNYDDLKDDPRYLKITARMCLDHTTGFPNWRWDYPDHKLKIAFEPGSRYSYSGEGMVYLQTVIEHLTGKSLEQLVDEKIFMPLGMKNSAYTWLPRFEADYALGYNASGKSYQKDKDNEPRAPSTLETTLDDYTTFVESLLQGKLLKKASMKEMFSPQIRLRSIAQFGPLSRKDSTLNDHLSLSYGLGWGLLKSPYGWAAFKEGHGDGFQHYVIIFPETGTGIIIMTNSDNGESIFKELLEVSIGDTFTPWKWENYIPYDNK